MKRLGVPVLENRAKVGYCGDAGDQVDQEVMSMATELLELRGWQLKSGAATSDMVDNPPHYTRHPSGVECIEVTRHMNFNRGNVIKYIWRAGEKNDELEDLRKAAWYLADEIQRVVDQRGAAELERRCGDDER